MRRTTLFKRVVWNEIAGHWIRQSWMEWNLQFEFTLRNRREWWWATIRYRLNEDAPSDKLENLENAKQCILCVKQYAEGAEINKPQATETIFWNRQKDGNSNGWLGNSFSSRILTSELHWVNWSTASQFFRLFTSSSEESKYLEALGQRCTSS